MLLSNQIPAETQTEIKKECNGKIPKSRLHLSASKGRERSITRGVGPGGREPCPAQARSHGEAASGPKSGLQNSFRKIWKIRQMLLININCAINKLGVNN